MSDLYAEPNPTPAVETFALWLKEQGWEMAVDVCPHDSAEGGFLFTDDPDHLVDEYLMEHRAELRDFLHERGPWTNWGRRTGRAPQ